MVSKELIAAIIEENIEKVHTIIFKEIPLRLSDDYYVEALKISNKHQCSSITDYIQLTRLYRLLIENIKAKSIRGFEKIAVLTHNESVTMLREILKQLYKFYHCKINKLTPLHSVIAINKQFSLYATRGHLGEYQIVIHEKFLNQYHQMSKEGIAPHNIEHSIDETPSFLLEQEADDFMTRIKAAYTKFSDPASSLPLNLQDSITKEMLLDIYAYILNKPNILEPLTKGHSVRIDKHDSALKRTCNILLNESKQCLLMLETKRKKSDNTKDDKKIIGKGSYGTVKPAWRIDFKDPDVLEEWVNKTAKGAHIFQAEYESNFSEQIIANCDKKESELFNHTIQGAVFYKETFKYSQYSKRAIADLETIEKKTPFNLQNKLDIFGDILHAIDLMHQKGKVHQDIKPDNILIYKGERYYAKLTDFGISEDIFNPSHHHALSTNLFVSPEILIVTQSKDSPYHPHFHSNQTQHYSFAYRNYLSTKERWYDDLTVINYKLPHPSNDIWALGILLFKLLYDRYPKSYYEDVVLIENDILLSGLLKAERRERMTTKEAKQIYAKWVNEKLANPHTITPLYESSKSSASSSGARQNEWIINTSSGTIPLSALFKKNP